MIRAGYPRTSALLLAIVSWWSLGVSPAAADNPYDRLQRQRAQQVKRWGSSPRGFIPLLDLWRSWDEARPEVSFRALSSLVRAPRLRPHQRAYVGSLLARAHRRRGDLRAAEQTVADLGFVTRWRVIGPFDNEGKRGLEQEFGPELQRTEAWNDAAVYPGRARRVRWRQYPAPRAVLGYVDLRALIRPREHVCGYAETFVHAEVERTMGIWVGAGGAHKVWWNGAAVHSDSHYRQPDPDRDVAFVSTRAGWNRLLVKACVAEGAWGFYLRLSDDRGAPVVSLRTDASRARSWTPQDSEPPPLRSPRYPVSPLRALEAAAAGPAPSPGTLEALARILTYTRADDASKREAFQVISRAIEKAATVSRLELAYDLAPSRAEKLAFARRARSIAPTDRRARLLWARALRRGPRPEQALPVLQSVGESGVVGMRARWLRAQILKEFDLPVTAWEEMKTLTGRAGEASGWLARQIGFAEAAQRADAVARLRLQVLEQRPDLSSWRMATALDAVRRGRNTEAREHIDRLLAFEPLNTRNHVFAASLYEALGDEDEAHAAFATARSICPEDPRVIVEHGRLLLRMKQHRAAAEAFRVALSLRPQDAETRELLGQLRGDYEGRADQRWATPSRTLLKRRTQAHGYPVSVLQQLTVQTVFENGLSSMFRQYAAQAHNDEGARELRQHSIQFDPDSQRVEVVHARVFRRDGRVLQSTNRFERTLGEPWYRIYYDTRALVVAFTDLEPGDVVELQYRVDDIAHRNRFADYFGDLEVLRSTRPIRRQDYVLISPRTRKFYFNRPQMRQLSHRRRFQGGRRIDHFWTRNVPALAPERGMPGITEVAPYLHVSTYRDWSEVGRWWWGLVKDQLRIDDDLRRTVAGLVRDVSDVSTRIKRIHNWVVKNTRYVALEFGIHGFKPYRVPLVVQRGFGDCKDKASLLYVMLKEAGIDARIALVRTRPNGAIDGHPASLAVFDHAIAYVPELELFLDGTAEYNGTAELPHMDQGATVLIVGPGESRLSRTPILAPDRNRRFRRIEAHVDARGQARIDVSEEIVGLEAPRYRRELLPEGTRKERFERRLRTLFPGLDVESAQFESLDQLEAPVSVRYRARVPRFGRRAGGALVVPSSTAHQLLRALAPTPRRKHPLELGVKRSYREERIVRPPPGWRPVELPQGTVESRFGALQIRSRARGGGVEVHTSFDLRVTHVSPEDYPAFRRWVERADQALRQRVELAEGSS